MYCNSCMGEQFQARLSLAMGLDIDLVQMTYHLQMTYIKETSDTFNKGISDMNLFQNTPEETTVNRCNLQMTAMPKTRFPVDYVLYRNSWVGWASAKGGSQEV